MSKVLRPKFIKYSNIWFAVGVLYFLVCAITDMKTLGTLFMESELLAPFVPSDSDFFPSIQRFVVNTTFFLLVTTMPSQHMRRLAFFSSYKEMSAHDQKIREEANKPVKLGKCIAFKVERGGTFSTPTSTIETEQGYYRVSGDVGSIEKETPIYKVNSTNSLYIGLPSKNRKFDLI